MAAGGSRATNNRAVKLIISVPPGVLQIEY